MRTVTCKVESCGNYDIGISMPDDGTAVLCGGGCDSTIVEQSESYQVEPLVPVTDPSQVALAIASMSSEERATLSALLAGD